jgi:hypothetical protein
MPLGGPLMRFKRHCRKNARRQGDKTAKQFSGRQKAHCSFLTSRIFWFAEGVLVVFCAAELSVLRKWSERLSVQPKWD